MARLIRAQGVGLAAWCTLLQATGYRAKRSQPEIRQQLWQEMHRAAEDVAATASTHLADMRDKARVILALQEATGILSSPSAYHALARSLARDVLARASS